MRHGYHLLSPLVAGAFLLLTGAASAQQALPTCSSVADPTFTGRCTVSAEVYRFTIREMRLRATDGSFVTLGSGDRSFDVAQVSAGQAVGDYASGSSIPPATYNAIVPTLGGTWTVQGGYERAVDGGVLGDCVTTSGGHSTNPADKGEMPTDLAAFFTANPSYMPPDMQVSGSDLIITDTSASGMPLTVADGDGIDFTITFDAGSGLEFEYANGSCVGANIGPLGVTLAFTKH